MKFQITYLSQWGIKHVKTISAESQKEAEEKAKAYVSGTEYEYMTTSHGHSQIISVKQKDAPLTVFDAIRGMSVEEIAKYQCSYVGQCCHEIGKPPYEPCEKTYALSMPRDGQYHDCLQCWVDYLNSPYTKEDGE